MKNNRLCKMLVTQLVLITVIASLVLIPAPRAALAWEQGGSQAHEEINRKAVDRFFSVYGGNAKYANSPIDKAALFWGPEVGASSMVEGGHTVSMVDHNFRFWVQHGGYSSDEPNIWACVRHFYDPLSVNGGPQLTDHTFLHGAVYDALSAKAWAFEDYNNPFSWPKALEYYKQSMEIPESANLKVVPGSDFRDREIPVASPAQARSAFLAKSFRALGESLHMIGDMTQPAHNRNDSHPNGDLDPLESRITSNEVKMFAGAPVESKINDDINNSADVVTMYERIARWTNENFYTDDTIYDKASGVQPRNWEKPYPHPQFSDLAPDPKLSVKVYTRTFNGKPVRMVRQTYASYYSQMGTEPFIDFEVPPSFALEQAEVLIPIAIKANAKMISLFFPTLELSVKVAENKNVDLARYGVDYREFALTSDLKHLIQQDIEWSKRSLEIKYSGPGELWSGPKGKAKKIGDLKFSKGQLEKPVTVFIGSKEFEKPDKFQINGEDTLYVVVNAGGRNIKSNESVISGSTFLIVSPADLSGEPNKDYTFTAKVSGSPPNAKYEWSVNGKQVQSSATTTYQFQPKEEGTFTIAARLLDKDGKEVARGQASARIRKPGTAAPTTSAGGRWVRVSRNEEMTAKLDAIHKVTIQATSATVSVTEASEVAAFSGTWSEPPASLEVGQTWKGTVAVNDNGAVKINEYRSVEGRVSIDSNLYDSRGWGNLSQFSTIVFPLSPGKTSVLPVKTGPTSFEWTIPKSTMQSMQIQVLVSGGIDHPNGLVDGVFARVIYKYEWRK